MTKTPYGKSLWVVRCTAPSGAVILIDVHATSANNAEIHAKGIALDRWERFGITPNRYKANVKIKTKAYLVAPAKDTWTVSEDCR